MGEALKLAVNEWGGRFLINEAYRDIAEGLREKVPAVGHVPVPRILFVDNIDGTGKSLNQRKSAQIQKIPLMWKEIIEQMTGKGFDYVMQFYKANIQEMSKDQVTILVLHEMRHVGTEGEIIHHDIQEFSDILQRVGFNWGTTKRKLPDLLSDKVAWDKIQGPPNLFDQDLQVVK